MVVHDKGLDTKEKLKLTFYSYLIIKRSLFSKEFLAWWQGQGRKVISQKKKKEKKKNCDNTRILIYICTKKMKLFCTIWNSLPNIYE